MKAYVLINVRTGELKAVLRQIKRVGGLAEANMTFGPYDIVAIINAKNVNEIGHILAEEIQPIPGITETLTCLAVEG